MKKIFIVLFVLFCFVGMVIAEETGIVLKQSAFFTYNDMERKNATTVTALKTSPIESAPKWVNMIVDGWVFDAGVAYEDNTIKDAVVLMGREFGTLGKYVPWLIFPFKDKIAISIYPIGAYLPDIAHTFRPEKCFGLGYIKGTLKF